MSQNPLIIFVCEHGAAKSILAAAYFNQLARERNLSFQAIARGTHPDDELSAITVAGLQRDGLFPGEPFPQKLTMKVIETARQVIAFCELPTEFKQKIKVEQWTDIPPVSEDYERARDVIVEHLSHLLNSL